MFKERARRKRAERLKSIVESGTARSRITALSMAGQTAEATTFSIPAENVLSWGRALEHEVYPELDPNSTMAIYALTESSIVYQILPEVPAQMRSARARAMGTGPAEWKSMAEESTTRVVFEGVGEARVGEASDRSWQLFFFPVGATSETDMLGLGIMESYGGLSPREVGEFVAAKVHVTPENGAGMR